MLNSNKRMSRLKSFLSRYRSGRGFCNRNLLPGLLLLSAFSFSGCLESPVYQKQYSVPKNAWSYNWIPSFEFDITDTASTYNLYFLIRHTEAYPNSNIWLIVHTKGPGDSSFRKDRIEVPLAAPSGRWLGNGMGAIWEQRMPITRNDAPMRLKAGRYVIRLEQNMRSNPLPEVLQVGLRVEKLGVLNTPRKS